MANLTSSLTIKLVDDVSKPARTVAEALKQAGKQAEAVAKAMAGTGSTEKLNAQLAKLKLGAKDIETVAAAWKEYATSARLAAHASDWTKEQAAGVRRWESQTVSALRTVQREQAAFARASRRAAGGSGRHDVSGRQMAAGIVGGMVAGETAHFARHSLETYREFDKERRYGKAVMAVSDEQQQPLVEQAIRGGGTSKYNDIQWLEAQRELDARGLNVKQVMAIVQVASTLGQAMDKTLPEASRLLEGGMFGFGKDTSTYEKALANARRTADLQVKAAKISGMDADDVSQAYKYGAAPFRMAGLSEEQLLAFSAVGKKANMGGDEMGVAARALAANLLKPTAGARTAMMASGIDYSSFQKPGQPMKADEFGRDIAIRYGVELADKAKAALQKVFDDRAVVQDAAKFAPAIMKVLGAELGKDDAKSKKSIAGEANRFRDASMGGVDAQGLFVALMRGISQSPSLANAVFGAKQGARIRTAIGDPNTFNHKLDELQNHAEGYAQNISDARMQGFDGAVSRFEGAVKNLESALPRAFDNDGKGGILTGASDAAGRFVQALAEAPAGLQRLGTEAGLAAAAFAGFKGAEALMGGFGLKSAAAELIEAAHALMGAGGAGKVGAAGAAAAGAAATKPSLFAPIAALLAYQAGKEIISGTLDRFHPAYPQGYDPDKVGSLGFLFGDLWKHTKDGASWLKNAIIPAAHAEPSPGPRGDPAGGAKLGGIQQQADAAKAALDSVSATTVAPQVDTSGLAGAEAAAKSLLATLMSIQGAAKGAAASTAAIKVPSIGAANRGSFQASGDPGR